jgi:signal transduction histidine kinase
MRLSALWRKNSSENRRPLVWLAIVPPLAVSLGFALDYLTGEQLDKAAYDFLLRFESPQAWAPDSIILAIDEPTLTKYGGQAGIRTALADGLTKIAPARPAAIAVDVILAEPGTPASDDLLERAFSLSPNLVLASYALPNGVWNDPITRFRKHAVAVGQVHSEFDPYDAVTRDISLAKVAGIERRWSLAFAAFLAARAARVTEESPDSLVAENARIPTAQGEKHVIRIRFRPGGIPRVSIAALDSDPRLVARFAGKVVFVGETVQARDSWMTPYSFGNSTPGVEIHASVYETLARRMFLTDAPVLAVFVAALALAFTGCVGYIAAGGSAANVIAVFVLLASQALPVFAFSRDLVWPWWPGTFAVLLSIVVAAAWRHISVRRDLITSERQRARYQQAMQFVTHEMRTPLTAIQGSSELIGRYASMPEAKRKQIADMINSESRRLARMIETFLNVERLSAGQMDLKHERFPVRDLIENCVERARPIAERKEIEIEIGSLPSDTVAGDRELMEYAIYNLLTNAVKYSPPRTRVSVFGEDGKGGRVRLCVEDHGIGMDTKEVGRIFEKFYRTKRAEQSGEAGTGIGLSIVEQIVVQHGGSIQVESEPGKGSRFTLVLKRAL